MTDIHVPFFVMFNATNERKHGFMAKRTLVLCILPCTREYSHVYSYVLSCILTLSCRSEHYYFAEHNLKQTQAATTPVACP